MTRILPTTDLYFYNSSRKLIKSWCNSGPVIRLGANSFRCGNSFLLIRRDTPNLMEKAIRWPGKLIYLIDDDIESATDSFPETNNYRNRLIAFSELYYRRIIKRADIIVVSSDELLNVISLDKRTHARIYRIDPCWDARPASQDHFRDESTLNCIHLGSGSHSAALSKLTPALLSWLEQSPSARFSFIGKTGQHPSLDNHPQTYRIKPMTWAKYKRWLPLQRFHLAIYPLEETAFDRSRSINKILEHAIIGAVGVYNANWPAAQKIRSGAILVQDLDSWSRELTRYSRHLPALRDKALHSAKILAPFSNPTRQNLFWKSIFGLANGA